MKAFYSDVFVLPLPAGHRFPMGKYRRLRDRLVDEAIPGLKLVEAPAATDDELLLVHQPSYVAAVRSGTLSPAAQREIGFPWSPAMAERARRSVGATVAAARAALVDGLAGNVAGGTHHAYADRGSGYCVFNDVAVASRVLQRDARRAGAPKPRVAVIDLDVHQGNGTAAIFRNDDSVFTLSLHGARNFPFRKEASDIDVDLPDDCGDVEYLQALDAALLRLAAAHEKRPPDLVFYLAGADPHEGDRLGRLKLTAEGMAERDRRVFAWARTRGLPLVLTMAGGYGRDIDVTVGIQVETYRAAAASQALWRPTRQSAA